MSVGVKVIDDDHKNLLGLANKLWDSIIAQRGKQVLGDILDELVKYTTFHFEREEQLFAYTSYPDAARHKKEHDDLTKQVLAIQKRYKDGAPALTLEVMNFLKDWLYDHILGSDGRFGPYLNSKGIK
jgi:hemerythrin